MKYQKHITVVTADFNKELFTSHGLHINKLGKKTTAKQIMATCTTVFQEKDMASIPTHWKAKHSVTDNSESCSYSDNNKKENTVIDQNNEPVRMSKRNRNLPIINTVDFLWQMNTRSSNT